MSIYTSTRPMPYVYIGIHRVTGEIYIGYREKNVSLNRTSNFDLPLYKTSSKKVCLRFDEFEWVILAEFLSGDAAYDFEQLLIFSYWGNPLLINQWCQFGKRRFKSPPVMTPEVRAKIAKGRTGKTRIMPESEKLKRSVINKQVKHNSGRFTASHIPWNTGKAGTYSTTLKGIPLSTDHKAKVSATKQRNKLVRTDQYKLEQSLRMKLWWEARKRKT